MTKDDVSYLKEIRELIDNYLFLGFSPSKGSPGYDKTVEEMENALKNPEFSKIRRKYNQMKAKAKSIIDNCSVDAVLSMRLPVAAGGGIISSHILDLVTENIMWQKIDKQEIFDIIDEAIGKIQMGSTNKSDDVIKKNIFISHGPETEALKKVEDYIRDLGLNPIIAEKKPTEGRDIDPDVIEKMHKCDAVIILGTGDDAIDTNTKQPRGNVISEIRLAEQKNKNIVYLLEKNAKFPSLHSSKAWETFEQCNMEKAFAKIAREFIAFKIIKT